MPHSRYEDQGGITLLGDVIQTCFRDGGHIIYKSSRFNFEYLLIYESFQMTSTSNASLRYYLICHKEIHHLLGIPEPKLTPPIEVVEDLVNQYLDIVSE